MKLYQVVLMLMMVCGGFVFQVNAQCVYNATSCTCMTQSTGGTCARYESGDPGNALCRVDQCASGNYVCDCSGTEICSLEFCDSWRFADEENISLANLNQVETCFFVSRFSPIAAHCVSRP